MGDIQLNPSRQHEGVEDIMFNERSQVTCVRNLGFHFEDLTPKKQQSRSIGDILSDPREHQMVSKFE